MRIAQAIELDAKTTSELLRLSKGRRVEARVQQRACAILLAAQGWQNKDIACEVKLDRRQVALWRSRFIDGGVPALLKDASRAGRTPSVTPEIEARIVHTTLHETPPRATQWSTRSLALHLGLSATTIGRVWRRNDIQPHRGSTPLAPADPTPPTAPRFDGMSVDVVGLYMNPRERVLVLGCAPKGPVQALDRTLPRHAGMLSGDPSAQGTTSLLTGIKKLEDTVMAVCEDRHRHEEWLKFLRLIDRKTPGHLQLHLLVDNQATHKRPRVQAWLARHPRLIVHSTPANVSWFSSVRRFLRELCVHPVHHDSFSSAANLQQGITRYIERQHKEPGPFVWTANATNTSRDSRAKAALARWTISAEQNGALQHEAGVTGVWA